MRYNTVALQHHLQPLLHTRSPAPLLPSRCLRCHSCLAQSRTNSHTPNRPRRTFTTSLHHPTKDSTQTPPANPPQTHYDIFSAVIPRGPPPAGPFAIDTRALKRAFLKLQATAHPDHHPPALKTRAEATSARLSEAYKTLEDPLLRAQYLLSLRGIDVAGDESTMLSEQDGQEGLLADVMEGQEIIEEAEGREELEELQRVNEARLAECVRRLGELFEGNDVEGATREAVRLRYWVNIKEGIREFEPGKEVRLVH